MLQMLPAGIWTLVDGLHDHDAHQATHAVASVPKALIEVSRQRSDGCPKRILRKYAINFVHQINCRLIEAYWRVAGRGPADREQLAFATKTQAIVLLKE